MSAVKKNQETLHNHIQAGVEEHWNSNSNLQEPVSDTFFGHENIKVMVVMNIAPAGFLMTFLLFQLMNGQE